MFEAMLENPQSFVSNVKTKLELIDGIYVSINEEEYENSYVTSLYSFLPYAKEEMERHCPLMKKLLHVPFSLLGWWLRVAKFNRVVMVNNRLVSTNLYEGDVDIHEQLKERFPTHAICYRSLNPFSTPKLYEKLSKRCRMMINRSVYFFDPKRSLPSRKRYILSKDLKLWEQEGIELIFQDEMNAADVKRLYMQLYLDKYSRLNPQFTTLFIENAFASDHFHFFGARQNGRLIAVVGYYRIGDIATAPIFGYDTSLPASLGLYRMLSAHLCKEAMDKGFLLHMSAGAGHFKRQRGGFQVFESMAFDVSHLPLWRRLPWLIFQKLFNTLGKRTLTKKRL